MSAPDGTVTTSQRAADQTRETLHPDGTRVVETVGGDPRFGMESPIVTRRTVTTPGGLTRTVETSRSVSLNDPSDVLGVAYVGTGTTVNGRYFDTLFDGAARTVTTTSAAGRQAVSTFDGKGRLTRVQTGTLTPVEYSYDAQGRPATVTQGTRTISYSYNSKGEVVSVTDPLSRTVRFDYDGAGRVITQTRPDDQSIGFGYDNVGNVTALTPPSRPIHDFTFTPVNLVERYEPPQIGGSSASTFSYSIDREPDAATRPDGQQATTVFDATGRVTTLTTPTGTSTFGYEAGTGHLTSVSSPDATVTYALDGSLPIEERWTGTVSGRVRWTFNNDFAIASEQVNDETPVALGYDADGLLTQIGELTLSRDSANGLITDAVLGTTVTTFAHDGFGAVSGATASVNGSSIYGSTITRDAAGRIAQKTETVAGITTVDVYSYDAAGRLTTVTRDGAVLVSFTYDANGNRLTETTGAGPRTATYDAQDRLVSYGSTRYSYTAAGELRTRTSPTTGTDVVRVRRAWQSAERHPADRHRGLLCS